MLLFACSKLLMIASLFWSAQTNISDGPSFSSFTNASNLHLVGDAAIKGKTLELTPNTSWSAGACWWSNRMDVTSGFVTTIRCHITSDGVPSDGLALFLSKGDTTSIGDKGYTIGTGGLDGIAIFLDTYQNKEYNEIEAPRVAIARVQGSQVQTLAETTVHIPHLLDSDITLRVVSDGKTIETFVNGSKEPAVTTTLDLSSIGFPESGAAVGLTSSTGTYYSSHDILSWYFRKAKEQPGRLSPRLSADTPAERVEKSLFDLTPVTGNVNPQKASAGGRAFDRSAIFQVGNWDGRVLYSQVVYKLDASYDLLEAWVGILDNCPPGAVGTFEIKGDGETIYKSREFKNNQAPEHLSIDIRGRKSIAIIARGSQENPTWASFSEPILVQLPSSVPQLISPTINEKVSGSTPLVWKGVDGANGYLLEVQCTEVATVSDEDRDDLFFVKRLPASTTFFTFDGTMPKGKYRWRVHALRGGKFLGEMKEWSAFTYE